MRHRQRIKRKAREKVRSNVAKDLLSAKYRQRVVEDKRGKMHDLGKLSNRELIELIQDNE